MKEQVALIYCLAIRAYRQRDGDVDVNELADFLDKAAGREQWLATRQWLFRSPPPVFRPDFLSVPVVCRHETAVRFQAPDEVARRLVSVETVVGAHLRRWRWVAFQVRPDAGAHGAFPWEQPSQVEATHA